VQRQQQSPGATATQKITVTLAAILRVKAATAAATSGATAISRHNSNIMNQTAAATSAQQKNLRS